MSGVLLQNIDPTLLLTAFLPILLFAGAFALEWHTVRRLIWSSLLLAGTP
jgi:NhaP-type Na+/H+ or K+/H+ antiporter